MNKEQFIVHGCKMICVNEGMKEEKAESLAQIALAKFKKNELTNSRAIQTWLTREIKRLKTLEKKNANKPT